VTELPTGTVTFLFTDIEGSSKLLQELGDSYGPVQDDHMRLMREAIAAGGGRELRTEGTPSSRRSSRPRGRSGPRSPPSGRSPRTRGRTAAP
jgi:class 3 adenylate cyclase